MAVGAPDPKRVIPPAHWAGADVATARELDHLVVVQRLGLLAHLIVDVRPLLLGLDGGRTKNCKEYCPRENEDPASVMSHLVQLQVSAPKRR